MICSTSKVGQRGGLEPDHSGSQVLQEGTPFDSFGLWGTVRVNTVFEL